MMRIFLVILCLTLNSCSGSLGSFPTNPDGLAANTGTTANGQTLIFQGQVDIGTQAPGSFDLPLPAPALEARLFIYGKALNRLFYSELPQHTHPGIPATTMDDNTTHSHSLYSVEFVLEALGYGGQATTALSGQCGIYRSFSFGNPACNGARLVGIATPTHFHDFTAQIDFEGIAALDEQNQSIQLAGEEKTYIDHLQVILNGEDISSIFDLNPLGDGTADHALNAQGAQADVSTYFAQSGQHRMIFRIDENQSPTSLGGQIHYVLWLRVPIGQWDPITTGT